MERHYELLHDLRRMRGMETEWKFEIKQKLSNGTVIESNGLNGNAMITMNFDLFREIDFLRIQLNNNIWGEERKQKNVMNKTCCLFSSLHLHSTHHLQLYRHYLIFVLCQTVIQIQFHSFLAYRLVVSNGVLLRLIGGMETKWIVVCFVRSPSNLC